MLGGTSTVLTSETVVDESLIANSSKISKSTLVIDSCHFTSFLRVSPSLQEFTLYMTLTENFKDSKTTKTR